MSKKPPKQNKGSYVNIGLLNDCLVDKILTAGLRVTVKLEPDQDLRSKKVRGKIVSPLLPRAETGVYWGYTVRIAKSLSDIFTKSPYEDGYNLTIGTSDKGESLQSVESNSLRFDHALVVFGGVQGLEAALENDNHLNADDPSLLFDQYLNVVPTQGECCCCCYFFDEFPPSSLLFISDDIKQNICLHNSARFANNPNRRSYFDCIGRFGQQIRAEPTAKRV